MTTTTHHCDRCKAEIPDNRTLLRVETGPLLKQRKEIDICQICLYHLQEWIDTADIYGLDAVRQKQAAAT